MSNATDFFPTGKPLRVTTYTSGTGTHTFLTASQLARVTIVAGGGGGGGVFSGGGAAGGNGSSGLIIIEEF